MAWRSGIFAVINLLPWRDKKRKKQQWQLFILLLGGTIMIIIGCIVWYFLLVADLHKTQKANQTIQLQLDKMIGKYKDLQELNANKKILVARLSQIEKIYKQREQGIAVLKKIAATIPRAIYLVEVTKTGDEITLAGIAHAKYELSDFTDGLEKSDLLTKPVLEEVKDTEAGASKFVIKCQTEEI
jgi:type IV pilus assembly protein PilN